MCLDISLDTTCVLGCAPFGFWAINGERSLLYNGRCDMGYHSDVRMTICGPKPAMIKIWYLLRTEEISDDAKHILEPGWFRIAEEENDMIFCFEVTAAKWYDDFPEVMLINRLWDIAAEEAVKEANLSGAYVRIGEDDADVEARYFGNDGYDLASVRRGFDTQYSRAELTDVRSQL